MLSTGLLHVAKRARGAVVVLTGLTGTRRASQFSLAVAFAAAATLLPLPFGLAGSAATTDAAATEVPWVELEERRTRTSKTFATSNGLYRTVSYGGPVHYRDAAGDWRQIDSALVPSKRASGYALRNKANSFTTEFKQDLGEDYLRLEVHGKPHLFSLAGAAKRAVTSDRKGRAAYKDALPGVELRYDVLPEGVKETLVLASADAPSSFRFLLSPPPNSAMRTVERRDGSWAFHAEGAPRATFVIAAPWASETSRPETERHVEMTVTKLGSRFAIDLEIDEVWLRDPARRFPVIVDPTITVQPAADEFQWIQNCLDCQAGAPGILFLGNGSPDDTSRYRAAIKFDLSELPLGANVSAAELGLAYDAGDCEDTGFGTPWLFTCHAGQLDVHRMLNDWSAAMVGSDLGTGYFDVTASASTTFGSLASDQWLGWNLQALVQSWVSGTNTNHGLMVKGTPETNGSVGTIVRSSEETFAPELRPKLEVTYTTESVDLYDPETLHSNGADLRWSRHSGTTAFETYQVHRSATAGFTPSASTLVATIGDIDVTTYRDTTAAPQTAFSYKVTLNGSPSVERRVTLPADGLASKLLQPAPAEGESTFVQFASGSTSCADNGADEYLWLGSLNDSSSQITYRPLLRFDVRDIPAEATVSGATLSLHQFDTNPSATTVNVHRVTAAWQEGIGTGECSGKGATWYETQAGVAWGVDGGDFVATAVASLAKPANEPAGWDDFTVTSAVQAWVDGTAPNHGLLLKAADESPLGARTVTYYGDDFLATPTLRPRLAISYADGSQTTAPTVGLSKPAAGETVSGSALAVEAAASDDGQIAKVELLVDGALAATLTAAPYAFTWNTTAVANGNHALAARATDDAGNTTTSADVTVNVHNSAPPTTAITSPQGTPSYDATILADSPVGYWRLGETSGTSAADASGNGHGGTYTGAYTQGQPGLLTGNADTAVSFQNAATDGGISAGGFSSLIGGSVTAEAWVTYAAATGVNRVIARGWGTDGGWMLNLFRTTAGAQVARFSLNDLGVIVHASAPVTPGLLHLAGTYDGSNVRLYVNGTQAAQVARAGVPLNSAAANILIGRVLLDTVTIDEPAVYGSALSATTIQAHYTAGTTSVEGVVVSGTVPVSADATDDLAVAKVEFLADGLVYAEDDTAPYSADWNTLSATAPAYDGEHVLTTRAYDSGGQTTVSAPVNVTVANTDGTKYDAAFAPTEVPAAVTYDPAAVTQADHGIDVELTNESAATWSNADIVARYRWIAPNDTDGATAFVDSADIALGGDVAPGTARTVAVLVKPPVLPAGVQQATYDLRVDLYDKATGNWFAGKGNKPVEQPVIVRNKDAVGLGLERYYHYVGEDLGGGMQQLVNVASGNSIVRWTPFQAPGRGLSTVVDLTYNSLEKRCNCPEGHNWNLSISSLTAFGRPLEIHPNKADELGGNAARYIEFVDGDGTTHRFTSSDGISWQAPAGVHLYLRTFSDTDATRKWALTRPDRVTFYYDTDGFPTSVEDKNGNRITYTLESVPSSEDPQGPGKRVTKVTDAGGRDFTLAYYSKAEAKRAHVRGKLKSLKDHSGSELAFDYYEDGNLLRITQVGGTNADGSFLADRSWVFSYTTPSGSGPAITDAQARTNPNPRTSAQSTRLFGVVDPRGAETSFAYLGSGSGNDRWKLASRTNRAGETTSFSYAAGETTVTEPLSRISSYAFNSDGQVTTITNPKAEQTIVAWSADRHVTKVTEPTGTFVELAYNQNGYLTDEWDQLRNQTKLTYQNLPVDSNDAELSISQLVEKTDPNGTATATPTDDYQWSFGYDVKGNLTSVTDPEGFASTTSYNPDGTTATATDAKNRVTTIVAYDAGGLPTEISDAKNQTTRLGYDVDGLLRWIQDPLHAAATGTSEREYKTVLDYDGFHRLGRQSTPKSTQNERGTLIWSSVGYDANDNTTVESAPSYDGHLAGSKTTTVYDAMDRPTLATGPDRPVDPEGERTQLEYDAAGRLHRTTLPKGVPTSNPDDYVTEYGYDLLDRIVTSSRFSGAGSVLRTHACYDLAGDLRWQIAAKAGLATAPTTCTGTTPSHTVRYAYDAAHRPLSQTDPLGRQTSVAYDANGAVVSTTDEAGTTTTREYNERGELVEIVEPLVKDAQGTVTRALTTRLEYDAVGNLKREISPRAWDASADKQTFTDFVTEYVYDDLDRLTRIDLPRKGAEARHYVHRAYDPNGNLTMVSQPVDQIDPAVFGSNKKTLVDHLDTGWIRTQDDAANPKAVFDYTAEGWQTERTPYKRGTNELNTSRRMSWNYFADGQLESVTDKTGVGKTVYSYDANGNLLRADESRGLSGPDAKPMDVEAAYDLFDRLTKVRRQDQGQSRWTFTSYGYDNNDNLIAREDDGEEQTDGTPFAAGRKHEFSYDGADWITTQLDRGTNASSTSDDRLVTNTFTPTGWEQLRKIESRDGADNFTVLKQETEWGWRTNGKLRTLETRNGAGTVLEKHTVSYEDAAGVYVNGHRTKDVFRLQGPNTAAPCRSADCTTAYQYDARERLVEEAHTRGGTTTTTAFALDPAGNIETQTTAAGVREFTYIGDQIHTLTEGTSSQRYWYDDEGNLDCVTVQPGGDRETDCNTPEGQPGSLKLLADYAYDPLNRLAGVKTYTLTTVGETTTSAAQKNTSYGYDALGRTAKQIEKHTTDDPRTTLYRHLGLTGEIAQEEHYEQGALQTTKAYGYDAFQTRLSMTSSPAGGTSQTFGYGYDVHGSVSLLLKADGTPQGSYAYEPYGELDEQLSNELQHDGTGATNDKNPLNPYRYTAKRFDSGSGTLDMGARRFGPSSNHFLQSDLYDNALANLSLSTNPLTANRYSLAGGNPVGYIEADGHRPDPSVGGNAARKPRPSVGEPFTPSATSAGERNASRSWDRYSNSQSVRNSRLEGTRGRGDHGIKTVAQRLIPNTPEWYIRFNRSAEATNDFDYVTGPAGFVRAGVRQATGTVLKTLADDAGSTATKATKATTDDVAVIGRQPDTDVAKHWPGHKVLNIQDWTVAKNDAWVQGVIRRQQRVYVGSPTTVDNLWDAVNDRPTVFARELQQFFGAGYRRQGDILIPPG